MTQVHSMGKGGSYPLKHMPIVLTEMFTFVMVGTQ